MEAKLKAIADKICAHFDLTPVGVNIAEQEKEINGRYVPQSACAPAQILISSTHDPCCSMDDILLHELAHHLQHSREPGSSGDHGEDFFRAIFDVVSAHYRDPIEYDWFFDCVSGRCLTGNIWTQRLTVGIPNDFLLASLEQAHKISFQTLSDSR